VQVAGADAAVLDGQQNVAGFLHGGGARIHYHQGARHQARIGLAVIGRQAPTAITWVPGTTQASSITARSTRWPAHHIGIAHGVLGGIAGSDLRPARIPQARRIGLQARIRGNRAPAEGFKVAAGLHSGAEDGQHAGIGRAMWRTETAETARCGLR